MIGGVLGNREGEIQFKTSPQNGTTFKNLYPSDIVRM